MAIKNYLTKEEITQIKQLRMEYEEPLKKYDASEIIKSNEILNEMNDYSRPRIFQLIKFC